MGIDPFFRIAVINILKIGGKVLEQPTLYKQVLQDWILLGNQRLLVHGGGKTAGEISARLGIEAPMIQGRRITSPEMLEVALMVYGGLMNKQLVAELQALGSQAIGMTGADLDIIRAHKRPVKDIDYGLAGDIDTVNAEALLGLIEANYTPVLAPLTHDGAGQFLNTNADTIAARVSAALAPYRPVQLTYLFEQAGVMEELGNPDSLIPRINGTDFLRLKERGIIHSGMIPKLDNAFYALEKGVERVYICRFDQVSSVARADFRGTILSL